MNLMSIRRKRPGLLLNCLIFVTVANKAGNQSKALGLKYVTENAYEAIKGNGLTSFGTAEFLANVNSNVVLQFDTGNFFCLGRV